MEARDKIAAARVWLIKHKPFFGVLARALRVEASDRTPAFRLLPDDRLLFAPDLVLALPFPALCARLAHLCMHASLACFGRRGPREAGRWNVAHDLAIDGLLEAAQLSVAAPHMTAQLGRLPRGASAENYYEILPSGIRPQENWCDLCDVDPSTDGAQEPKAEKQDSGPPAASPPLPRHGTKPISKEDISAARDGAAQHVPSVQDRGRELQWSMRLAAAYEEEIASGGATFGEMPDWIDETLRATIEPPSHWAATLQRAVSSLHRSERSYLRPSRRMSALVDATGRWPDMVAMPGRRIKAAGVLVAIIDTSASIGNDTLARFLGSIVSVATAEGIDDVRLMQADADITHDETRFAAELLFMDIDIRGRGGTNFAPALERLAEEAKRGAESFTVAYLTDLDGSFPPAASVSMLDVLWVTPHKTDLAPPFGRQLTMTAND
ncbi:MAG: VWA-like domain-containing protein [Polyangiaceae bacterium]